MKNKLTLIFISLALSSCFFNAYESEPIKSPTGNFTIKARVNRTDKNVDDYADVMIHIFDLNGKKLNEFNTGASDSGKWAFGWTVIGDTIVIYSSDIGNKAWVLENRTPTEIKLTKNLDSRAEFLKSNKYKY